MARVNQKRIRELLETYAAAEGKLQTLQSQRDAAVKPLHDKFYKQVERVEAGFADDIESARGEAKDLREIIEHELQRGFDIESNSYSTTKVESESALVEVNSRDEREISAESWLKEVPKRDQTGGFFDTLKVMVTKADGFRSDIVNRLATLKRTHRISVKLK